MLRLREALEASWDSQTAYANVHQDGNPALGQCYPTSRVVQHFYPKTEIAKGEVWTGRTEEIHFWNCLQVNNSLYHIDLSWQQFASGSIIRKFVLLDRHYLNDSQETLQRCNMLLERVNSFLRDLPPSGK